MPNGEESLKLPPTICVSRVDDVEDDGDDGEENDKQHCKIILKIVFC